MITQDRLRELLCYDMNTGLFTWRKYVHGATVGEVAGCVNSDGYVVVKIDGYMYGAHRLAIIYTDGYIDNCDTVDHEDRIRHHNWRKNLRVVTHQQQQRNRSLNSNNTTGVCGICRSRGRWQAQIAIHGKQVFLGRFHDIAEAVCHRYAAEQCLGFPYDDNNSSAAAFIKQFRGKTNG